MILEMPNEVEYDLFDLRDLYAELEGSPLGPYYEEEDINEENRKSEWKDDERTEQFFSKDNKIAA